jgi:hypothetical protein
MDDRKRLEIEKDLLCARIELEGMIADNKQSELTGDVPAYVEDDFLNIINAYGLGHNAFTERIIESY